MVRACFNGAAGYSIWRKLILEVACISRTTADHAYARNYLTWHRIIVNILLIWCQSVDRFLSLSSMLEPELTIGGVSICPSVCLSHAHTRINSKLMTVVSCSRHRRVAQGLLFFCYQLSHPTSQGNPLARASYATTERQKTQIFNQ